jgi:hypothetical protein
MAWTPVQIINMGLGKIAASRINSITPAVSPIEKHCLDYPQWRDSELTKREWVFAHEVKVLPLNATITGYALPYRYALPPECLRPLRTYKTTWEQRGRFLFSDSGEGLTLEIIERKPEAEWDALFVDVMAGRVAVECSEFTTQSNTKTQIQKAFYDEAIAIAGQANAFIIGPRTINPDGTSWQTARENPEQESW